MSGTKTKEQGKCIFCGGLGLSKQHVWPDWLKSVIPRNSTVNIQELHSYSPSSKKALIDSKKVQRQGHLGVRKIRNVCKDCNNGWMSKIEQKVKPFLTSLILAKETILIEEEMRDLASWVIMTSIMAEFTDIATLAIPQEHRKVLYETANPPDGWRIWIGRYKGVEWGDMRYRHHGSCIVDEYEAEQIKQGNLIPKPNVQSSSFVIGELFIHCISLPPNSMNQFLIDDELNKYLTCIWPIEQKKRFFWSSSKKNQINWPPLNIIDDRLAFKITDRTLNEEVRNALSLT